MNYREDGVTPYMVFWKDGLKEVKLVRVFRSSSSQPVLNRRPFRAVNGSLLALVSFLVRGFSFRPAD